MEFELRSTCPPGSEFADLARKHAADFAVAAPEHDRDGTFPADNWNDLRRSGFLAATVPAELGGMGVESIADIVVAISALARGDASTALGAAMHCTAFWYLARRLSDPDTDSAQTAGLRLLLRRCARGHTVACVTISERGTSLGFPRTTAVRAGDGYEISGRKMFCTNSPAATVFLASVRLPGPAGDDELGFAVIPRDAPGVRVDANWDALGMRGSGSGDVVFSSCVVPARMVRAAGPIGVLSAEILPLTMVGTLAQVGVFLGIAELAQELAVAAATRQRPGSQQPACARPAVQGLIGENEADLAAGRAVLSRTAMLLDQALPSVTDPSVLPGLMAQVQCANMTVKRSAIAIVDRCLTTSGGQGYLSSSVLSRLYRDVRAGPFMQPFSALDAFEYIGQTRL